MKEKLIDIIVSEYGMTKREATNLYKKIDTNFKKELLKGYENNAKFSVLASIVLTPCSLIRSETPCLLILRFRLIWEAVSFCSF